MLSRKRNFTIFSILLIVFLVSSILLFKTNKPDYRTNNRFGPVTTVGMNTLRKLFLEKLDYIKNNSSLFRPFNSRQIDIIKSKTAHENLSLNELGQLNMLAPNSYTDFGPITRPHESPLDTTCFQFVQGWAGWYWLYGTFVDTDGTVKSFMFYLIRLELVPEAVLNKHNLKPGEATIYYISCGVGNGNTWVYSPYLFVRGTYNSKSKTTFSFKALAMPDRGICSMSGESPQKFDLQCKWKDPSTGKMHGYHVSMNSAEPPKFNTPDGCAPCIGGEGTLYWSYTDLRIQGELLLNNKSIPVKNGVGWMDHQWGGSGFDQLSWRIIFNIYRLFSMPHYFGRYIWLNLHLPGEQYLIYTFPRTTVKQKDDYTDIVINKYAAGKKTDYNIKGGKLTVLETKKIDNTDYPVAYELQMPNKSYILDGKMFGDCVTVDLTGNFHWSGSAMVKNKDGKKLGTAFLEANQLQDPAEYLKVQMKHAGIDDTYLAVFNEKHLSIGHVLPSLLFVLFYFFAFCAMIISGVFLIKNKK